MYVLILLNIILGISSPLIALGFFNIPLTETIVKEMKEDLLRRSYSNFTANGGDIIQGEVSYISNVEPSINIDKDTLKVYDNAMFEELKTGKRTPPGIVNAKHIAKDIIFNNTKAIYNYTFYFEFKSPATGLYYVVVWFPIIDKASFKYSRSYKGVPHWLYYFLIISVIIIALADYSLFKRD